MEDQLTLEEQKTLLRMAREAMEHGVRHEKLPPLETDSLTSRLREDGAPGVDAREFGVLARVGVRVHHGLGNYAQNLAAAAVDRGTARIARADARLDAEVATPHVGDRAALPDGAAAR